MKGEKIVQLNDDWRNLYQEIHRAIHIYRNVPDAFSRNDINENFNRLVLMKQQIIEDFDIDESRDWDISLYTGLVYYKDKLDPSEESDIIEETSEEKEDKDEDEKGSSNPS